MYNHCMALLDDMPEPGMTPREAALAGFVTVEGKWKRISPDIRNKINIRKAERQPDGTWYIADVDVFYPNNAKGGKGYTAYELRGAIKNTNAMIARGSQTPSIACTHDDPNAYGRVVNWQESDKGEGWVKCDFAGMPDEVYNDWRTGKYTGLSAMLMKDNGEMIGKDEFGSPIYKRVNLRFGHVALLGSELGQLSELPMTQIYAATEATECVCYSAMTVNPWAVAHSKTNDLAEFEKIVHGIKKTEGMEHVAPPASHPSQKENTMTPEEIKKLQEEHSAMKAKFDAMDGSYKVDKAKFAADEAEAKKAKEENEAYKAKFGALDANPNFKKEGDNGAKPLTEEEQKILADKLAGQEGEITKEAFAALKAQNDELCRQMRENSREKARNIFAAEVDGLIAAGHAIDKRTEMETYAAMEDAPAALVAYRASLVKRPKAQRLSSIKAPADAYSATPATEEQVKSFKADFYRKTGQHLTDAQAKFACMQA